MEGQGHQGDLTVIQGGGTGTPRRSCGHPRWRRVNTKEIFRSSKVERGNTKEIIQGGERKHQGDLAVFRGGGVTRRSFGLPRWRRGDTKEILRSSKVEERKHQ